LPSTRAIETRSLPTSLAATHRGFAFYVAFPKSSIPSVATCSMSLIPQLRSVHPEIFGDLVFTSIALGLLVGQSHSF
jgi:hypothetical protein